MKQQVFFSLIQKAEFKKLFNQLGWDYFRAEQEVRVEDEDYKLVGVAEKRGFVVFACMAEVMPEWGARIKLHQMISKLHFEHLIIYYSASPQQVWQLALRQPNQPLQLRETVYRGGEPWQLFERLRGLLFTLDEEDQITLVDVTKRVQESFVRAERVTKQFYAAFQQHHQAFLAAIQGITQEVDKQHYVSILINRLMFIWFLQKQGFLAKGDRDYLPRQLAASQQRKADRFYRDFLCVLFFHGFARSERMRSAEVRQLLGAVPYLNGGLFLPHRLESEYEHKIQVPDQVFADVFGLFDQYAWNLNDTPSGEENEINPDVLGYIFEKYINQKQFGAYYTRPEITEYLCQHTIYPLILDKVRDVAVFADWADLLAHLDAGLCQRLVQEVLPSLRLLDPACGSGAFLVAAMKTLIAVYSELMEAIPELGDAGLCEWREAVIAAHPSLEYYVKKRIITDNVFGVDLMEEAAEIAKLRLFLALVASVQSVEQLEPLPNIEFNVLAGNSLIGLLAVDAAAFDELGVPVLQGQGTLLPPVQGDLLAKQREDQYQKILKDKNKSIDLYKKHAFLAGEEAELDQETRVLQLRDHIEKLNKTSQEKLNRLLLEQFGELQIEFEQAQSAASGKKVKQKKRPLQLADVEAQKPFHWGYHFDQVLAAGGFDGIIANPPWEVFKPYAKEFFIQHSELVSSKKMTIKEFEKEQKKLLQDEEIAAAWLVYQSQFPHISSYFRKAPQFVHQIAVVNGRKASSDLNLYKLFVEQCFNLLREGGACGIIVPSGIYTDLGTTGLRRLLFEKTQIEHLFGLSNERYIFEGVHHAFKISLLTFRKGQKTKNFYGAFRINPREALRAEELMAFFADREQHVKLDVELIKRLSPDSWSVMEFKNPLDVAIAERMLRFPLLGEELEDCWNLALTREFDMTNDSHLFHTEPAAGRLPLYEGKMIHQFNHQFAEPKYWVDEKAGRKAILGKQEDEGQVLDYQEYRLGIRSVASNTNANTLLAALISKNVFCGNSILASNSFDELLEMIFCVACLNSLTVDWMLRNKVSTNINMFYIYQIPVPRLTDKDPEFAPIVQRAAQLTCTSPEYDDLARAVGLNGHQPLTDGQRQSLRAELDAHIAHLYQLTEEELTHILNTFPLVSDDIKHAIKNAYHQHPNNTQNQ